MQARIHGKCDEDGATSSDTRSAPLAQIGHIGWLRRLNIAGLFLVVALYGANTASSYQANYIKQKQIEAQSRCPPAAVAPVPILKFDRPKHSMLDVNIGTNLSPMKALGDNFLLLVDPLMDVCNALSVAFQKNPNVHFLCLAVANYTGVSTFKRYNSVGVSSSLVSVSEHTSHAGLRDQATMQTVMVVEALPLLRGLLNNNIAIQRLKLDMQGFDYTVLRNLEPLLSESPARIHNIMAECFYPNKAGNQIYEIDNSCEKIKQYLESLGYTTRDTPAIVEWGDVFAYKAPATSLMSGSDF